ncbi:hypothetical protein BH10PSE7_BH10PSE7_34120 [soil metagenome]
MPDKPEREPPIVIAPQHDGWLAAQDGITTWAAPEDALAALLRMKRARAGPRGDNDVPFKP